MNENTLLEQLERLADKGCDLEEECLDCPLNTGSNEDCQSVEQIKWRAQDHLDAIKRADEEDAFYQDGCC